MLRPRVRNPALGGVKEELMEELPKTPRTKKEPKTPRVRKAIGGTPRPKPKSRRKRGDDSPDDTIFSGKMSHNSRLFKTAVAYAFKTGNREACATPKFADHQELKTEFLQLPERDVKLTEEPSSASSGTSFFPRTPNRNRGGLLTPSHSFSSSQLLTPTQGFPLSDEVTPSRGGRTPRVKTPAQLKREAEKLQREIMKEARKEVRANIGEDTRYFEFLSPATRMCRECRLKIIPDARRIKEIIKRINNFYHPVCFHRKMMAIEEEFDEEGKPLPEFEIGCWESNYYIDILFDRLSTKEGRETQKKFMEMKMRCMMKAEKYKLSQEERRRLVEEYDSDDESDSGCGKKNMRLLQKARGVKNPAARFARRTYSNDIHDADTHMPHPARFANNAGLGQMGFLPDGSANCVLRALDTPELQSKFACLDDDQRKEVSKLADEDCVRELMSFADSMEIKRVLRMKDNSERQKLIMLDPHRRSEVLAIQNTNERSEVLRAMPIGSMWNLEDPPHPIANKSLKPPGLNLKHMLAAIQDRQDRKAGTQEEGIAVDAKENSAVKKDYPALTFEGFIPAQDVPRKQNRFIISSSSSSHDVPKSKIVTQDHVSSSSSSHDVPKSKLVTQDHVSSSSSHDVPKSKLVTQDHVSSSSLHDVPKSKIVTEDHVMGPPSSQTFIEPRGRPAQKRPYPEAVVENPESVAAKTRRKMDASPQNDDEDAQKKLLAEAAPVFTASQGTSSSSSSAVFTAPQGTSSSSSVSFPAKRDHTTANESSREPSVVGPSTQSVQKPTSPVSCTEQWEDSPPIVKEVSQAKRPCRRRSVSPPRPSSGQPVAQEETSPTAARVTGEENTAAAAAAEAGWQAAPTVSASEVETNPKADTGSASHAALPSSAGSDHRNAGGRNDDVCQQPAEASSTPPRTRRDSMKEEQARDAPQARGESMKEERARDVMMMTPRTDAASTKERARDVMMMMTPRTNAAISDLTPKREQAFKIGVAALLHDLHGAAPPRIRREDAGVLPAPAITQASTRTRPRSDDGAAAAPWEDEPAASRRALRKTLSPERHGDRASEEKEEDTAVAPTTLTKDGSVCDEKTTPAPALAESASRRELRKTLSPERCGSASVYTGTTEADGSNGDKEAPSASQSAHRQRLRLRKTLSPDKHGLHEARLAMTMTMTESASVYTGTTDGSNGDKETPSAAESTYRQRLRKTLSPDKHGLHEARLAMTMTMTESASVQQATTEQERQPSNNPATPADAVPIENPATPADAVPMERSRRRTMSPRSIYGLEEKKVRQAAGSNVFETASPSSAGAATTSANVLGNNSNSNTKSNPMIGTTCAQRVKLIKNGAYPGKKAKDDDFSGPESKRNEGLLPDLPSLTQVVGPMCTSPTKSASPTSWKQHGEHVSKSQPSSTGVDRELSSLTRGSLGSDSMNSNGACSSRELCQGNEPSPPKVEIEEEKKEEETRELSAEEREAEQRRKQIVEAERIWEEKIEADRQRAIQKREADHQKEIQKVNAKYEAEKERKKLIWKQKLFQNEQEARSAKEKSAIEKEKEVSACEKEEKKKRECTYSNTSIRDCNVTQREKEEKKKREPTTTSIRDCEEQRKNLSGQEASSSEGLRSRKRESVATKKPSAGRRASTAKSRKMEKGPPVDDDDEEEKEVDDSVKSQDNTGAMRGQKRAARRKSTASFTLWNQTQLQNAESKKKSRKKSR